MCKFSEEAYCFEFSCKNHHKYQSLSSLHDDADKLQKFTIAQRTPYPMSEQQLTISSEFDGKSWTSLETTVAVTLLVRVNAIWFQIVAELVRWISINNLEGLDVGQVVAGPNAGWVNNGNFGSRTIRPAPPMISISCYSRSSIEDSCRDCEQMHCNSVIQSHR